MIISNENGFRMAPVFDNGRSLCTDHSNFTASCTLSGSFEEQVTAFGYPVKTCFSIDYDGLYDELESVEKRYGAGIEIITLRNRLKEYEDIFRD